MHRVARAGVTWGFLQRLADASGPSGPAPDGTRVKARCEPVGKGLVRCALTQRGGMFAASGVDTRAHGYFQVDDAGVVRQGWIQLDADEQRAAEFLRDLRSRLEESHPEVYGAVFDTELPLLYRRAFQDTLHNRGLVTAELDGRSAP